MAEKSGEFIKNGVNASKSRGEVIIEYCGGCLGGADGAYELFGIDPLLTL